ncbi:MAG: AmmeMemoRadiSam system protein B, partial [Candidatus Zipacnadales bacterium]
LIRSDQIQQIITQLDDALLLETPRLVEFRQRVLADYRASGRRPCAHAGGGYPSQPALFAQMVDSWLQTLSPREVQASGRLIGLIAPHIDFERGAAGYAYAYRELAENCDADLFIILGTDHHGETQFAATRNTFETPLGPVPVAQDALAQLELQFVGDLFEGELQHIGEHTIEFHAVLLKYFLGDRDFEIVPILCGGLSEELAAGETTVQDAETLSLIDCLRSLVATTARSTCVIASADLSHVGPRFGGNRLLTTDFLKQVEEYDRRILQHAVNGEPEAMFAEVGNHHNNTNICGLMPIYMLVQTLHGTRGILLHYEQATTSDRQQSVSFAAAAFYRP